jgi:hypothetical protein
LGVPGGEEFPRKLLSQFGRKLKILVNVKGFIGGASGKSLGKKKNG